MKHKALLVALVAGSCSSSPPGAPPGSMDPALQRPTVYRRPPVPEGALLLETTEFAIAPGTEVTYCHYTPVTTRVALETREVHSYQMRGGHHVALFYTTTPRPEGAHPCTDAEMGELRLIGGGDEGSELQLRLPDGLAMRVPAGAQLVLQSHYLNPDTTERRVRDALTIVPPRPGTIRQYVDAFAATDLDFAVPARGRARSIVECRIEAEMNIISLFGHMHDHGATIRMELLPAGSDGPGRELYNVPWLPRYRETAPVSRFTEAAPLVLRAGDRFRLHCDWNNTTSHVLRFPEEMCASLMYYYPARGFVTCTRVVERHGDAGDAGAPTGGNAGCSTPRGPGEACVRPCHTGNELGVGRYCTRGGNQCRGNRSAIFCTAEFGGDTAGWCTKGCSDNAGCGSGASCINTGQGSGCFPNDCRESADGGR